MTRLGEVCVHKSLARSCELCDLQAEVERLKAELAEDRRWSVGWKDLAHRAEAERDRLVDGIREHRLNYANPFASWTEREANERLWSLLDDGGSDVD